MNTLLTAVQNTGPSVSQISIILLFVILGLIYLILDQSKKAIKDNEKILSTIDKKEIQKEKADKKEIVKKIENFKQSLKKEEEIYGYISTDGENKVYLKDEKRPKGSYRVITKKDAESEGILTLTNHIDSVINSK